MNKLNFELTIEQTNVVLNALGRMPYEAVANLIKEIQKQAESQLNKSTEVSDAIQTE